ncbi:MAG: hypothetical protein ACJ72M_13905 [Propionibacteriaceae bacterium]
MLSWSTILYGALLSAIAAAALVAVFIRPRQLSIIATAAAAALLGPIAWNAILRATHGTNFFHDGPSRSCPHRGRTRAAAFLQSP